MRTHLVQAISSTRRHSIGTRQHLIQSDSSSSSFFMFIKSSSSSIIIKSSDDSSTSRSAGTRVRRRLGVFDVLGSEGPGTTRDSRGKTREGGTTGARIGETGFTIEARFTTEASSVIRCLACFFILTLEVASALSVLNKNVQVIKLLFSLINISKIEDRILHEIGNEFDNRIRVSSRIERNRAEIIISQSSKQVDERLSIQIGQRINGRNRIDGRHDWGDWERHTERHNRRQNGGRNNDRKNIVSRSEISDEIVFTLLFRRHHGRKLTERSWVDRLFSLIHLFLDNIDISTIRVDRLVFTITGHDC